MNRETFNKNYRPNLNDFFNVVENIGSELNSRKNRFDKADLIENALEICSGSRLQWVDEQGCDMIDPHLGIKFEVKSGGNCLFTKKGVLKEKTSQIKLVNTLQQAENKKLDVSSDYLLLVDTKQFAMGIVPYEDVVHLYSKELKDGFSCQIPTEKIVFLFQPEDYISNNYSVPSYAQEKEKARRAFILKSIGRE